MIDGEMAHQDSNGGGGLISNGDTQWMTAGAGILHIETPPEAWSISGGLFHGFQLWVNLPRDKKWATPRYQDIRGAKVGLLSSDDGGALVRLIAGDAARGDGGPRVDVHPDHPRPRDAAAGRRADAAVAPDSTRWSTRWPAPARRRRAAGRCGPGSSPCSAPATP